MKSGDLLWQSLAVARFSVGEYAALTVAGVIDITDVFPLVQLRADAMQAAVPIGEGARAAIMKLSQAEVINLCEQVDGYLVPANYNCPGQIVVSGEMNAVNELLEIAKINKIKAIKLPVSAPFHSKLMESAAKVLREKLMLINFSEPVCQVYMNVDAEPLISAKDVAEKLILQAKSPVYWEQTLRNMQRDGINTFIEFGPGHTLTDFVKKTFGDNETIHALNVENLNSLNAVVKQLGGNQI